MMVQYWTSKADYDLACPGLTGPLLTSYFRSY